ncbi:MAG: UDP-3-O-acyl-N-acetylglucosamine deacetylase, partial [Deltaproteobacteria bacterium]|nr:UDP-3-O-acyl-N-acetylglucosamine deacetylase [Deltaproteobacteria bacterium]
FRVLNEGGLRYEDEFVRHKILDLIGDISLLGSPIIGHFNAHKSGHTLNHTLLTKIMTTPKVLGRLSASNLTHSSNFDQQEAVQVTA